MSTHVKHRVGDWLPGNHRVLEDWLKKKIEHVHGPDRKSKPLHPVIQDFKETIENDPSLHSLFTKMFEEVPSKPPYNKNPSGKPEVYNYELMLKLLDHIITTAPEYEQDEMVGTPINAILDWPMGTPSGLQAFTNVKVNAHIRKVLNTWATFLASPESRYVLTTADNGWFGPAASKALPNFAETFVCDPTAEYYGFSSWDGFFTRHVRSSARPVEFPDNDDIINNACESTVYRIAHDVKTQDSFWLKGEPYSLDHMLNNDSYTPQFAGGTVYQAYLSALDYHRWQSPINGTIRRTVLVSGTYYAESPEMGLANPHGPDPSAPHLSQGYITAVATRALVFIEADNPAIGLMCFMAVGMVEVSTCETTVKEGDRVRKGDELGSFHFGGSTYCLIFRPETKLTFSDEASVDRKVKVNAAIAVVTR